MAAKYFNSYKQEKSELFKYVYKCIPNDDSKVLWEAKFRWGAFNKCNSKRYPTERDAALAVDKHLIKIGKEPVNILKRVN